MNNKKYAIYVRKSTDTEDNQVASIPDQLEVLRDKTRKLNLTIVEVFEESASAKNPGRPVFGKMMERIAKGEINGILAWKLNRLARNQIDGGQITHYLLTSQLKEIVTAERTYLPTDNVILMAVEFGMATQFSLDLRLDVKRGMTMKAERGLFPGRAPIGYINDPAGKKGYSEILPDPANFELVRKCWLLLLEEKIPVQRIYEIATEEWGLKSRDGKTPSRSQFYYLFENPIYYGKFEWADKTYQGAHKAMITEEEFWEAQNIIQNKSKDAPRTKFFAFTGFMKCGECGSSITAEEKVKNQKNGNVHHYTYYRCIKYKNKNCTQKCVREEEIEEQLVAFLESIEIPNDFHVWAMDKLRKENEKETEGNQKLLETAQRSYKRATDTLSNLIDMRAAGDITEEIYLQKRDYWNKQKDIYAEQMDKQQNQLETWLEKADRKLTLAEVAKQKFESLETAQEKKVFVAGIGSNLFLKDKILIIPKENVLVTIQAGKKALETINSSLEPIKTQGVQVDMGEIYNSNPTLCAYRDSNPN